MDEAARIHAPLAAASENSLWGQYILSAANDEEHAEPQDDIELLDFSLAWQQFGELNGEE